MDAKIKQLWVNALRSGKYRQARGFLRKNGAMCCLGVLCEIQGMDWKKAKEEYFDFVTDDVPREFNAGLRRPQRHTLAEMNDGEMGHKKHSFREIADYIAKNL